jgi:hypothetical protein
MSAAKSLARLAAVVAAAGGANALDAAHPSHSLLAPLGICLDDWASIAAIVFTVYQILAISPDAFRSMAKLKILYQEYRARREEENIKFPTLETDDLKKNQEETNADSLAEARRRRESES